MNDLTPAPCGVPDIEVTFEIDENGILNVSAVDKSSGSKGEIRITNDRNRPSEQEIQDMINESIKHEEEDNQKRLRVEAINKLESLCNKVKKNLEDQTLVCRFTEAEIQMMERMKSRALMHIDDLKSNLASSTEDFEKFYEELLGKTVHLFKRA